MHIKPLFLLFLIILISLFSCQNAYDDHSELTVFRYNEDGNITSLDPIYARNQSNIWATSQLFNSLLQLDEELNVIPSLAKEWEISPDGMEYIFYLRKDVYFHDDDAFLSGKGRRVVADDFVFSFSRLIDPALNSPGSWVMNPVARNIDESLNISAVSDTVLKIVLKEAFPPMPGLLCMQYCSVVPREGVEKYGADFRQNPLGTGPFCFKYWKEGVKLVFRKNPRYFEFEHDYRLPYLDAISISFIQDRQTAFLEFIKGNLDILTRIDASYKDELLTPYGELQQKHSKQFYKLSNPFLNTEYIGILLSSQKNQALSGLQQKNVRLAINHGFDREKMLLYLRNNMGTPAHAGFVPVGMPGFKFNTGGYEYNPDKARGLLAQAGYPGGRGLPPIELSTTSLYMDIGQYLQHELSRIGISIQINVMPPATLRETMAKAEAPLFRASWIADYPDAENYLALFYSPNKTPEGPNYTLFNHKAYDRLYEESKSIVNDSIRYQYYQRMDSIIIAEAPVIPLFYDQAVRFLPHYVSGLQTNPLNHMLLKRTKIDRKK